MGKVISGPQNFDSLPGFYLIINHGCKNYYPGGTSQNESEKCLIDNTRDNRTRDEQVTCHFNCGKILTPHNW
jgi:hypothetical protein